VAELLRIIGRRGRIGSLIATVAAASISGLVALGRARVGRVSVLVEPLRGRIGRGGVLVIALLVALLVALAGRGLRVLALAILRRRRLMMVMASVGWAVTGLLGRSIAARVTSTITPAISSVAALVVGHRVGFCGGQGETGIEGAYEQR
jgi:hypothetical protein